MTPQSRAICFQSQDSEIYDIRAFDFLKYESTSHLTDVPASIYDRKWRPDILTLSLRKGRNTPIWRSRNRGVNLRIRFLCS